MFNKTGKIISPFPIRLIGAIIASVGFFIVAFKPELKIIGAALVGIGSTILAAGD